MKTLVRNQVLVIIIVLLTVSAVGYGDQTPYHGIPFVLPTRIEAEDYDLGGEGVAYHDNDGGNNGNQWGNDYRTEESVDTEFCTDIDGGYNVGWMSNNEWLEYTVDVPATGEYMINIRVASLNTGGNFHIEFNGINATGNIHVPPTGGWQNWTTVSTTAILSAGTQIMRFVNANSSAEYNINYFEITAGQTPYHGTPFVLPTRIEAEDYDLGGEGVAYHDSDVGNNGSRWGLNDYRTNEDVDTEYCEDTGGGYNVGWMSNNEWLEYIVDVPVDGDYTIDIRVASLNTGGNFHIEFNGINVTSNIHVPPTGGWQNWTTVSATATLSAGMQVMRWVNANSRDEYNINYFDFLPPFLIDPPYEFIWIRGHEVGDCLSTSNGQEPYRDWLAIPLSGGFNGSVLNSSLFTPGTGIRQYWRADDYSWNYALPFSFNFYGTNYNSINICSNGYIDFGTSNADYSNSMQGLIENVRIAPLWDDLVINPNSSQDIYIDESIPGQVTIRWKGKRWESGDQVKFTVVLFDDGSIRFDYGNNNTNLSATVGVSAGNGNDYIIVPGYDEATALTYANSVLFTPIPGESPLPPGVNVNSITGCFEGAPETTGDYSAVIEVTDWSQRPKTARHSFNFEVIENMPPVADAGDDQAVFCWIDGLVDVTLNGSGSYDGDEDPMTYLWAWTVAGQSYSATGVSPMISLAAGVHTITLVVSDGVDDSPADEVVINAEPPVEVFVKCTPKSLNCDSNGNWIKAHFIVPAEFTIDDINLSAPCTLEPLGLPTTHINPFINEDGFVQVDVSFDRDELCQTDPPLGFTQMMPTGSLTSGHYFYGIDEIRILDNRMEHLINLGSNWLKSDCTKPQWCNGLDMNMDGVVDMKDFASIE